LRTPQNRPRTVDVAWLAGFLTGNAGCLTSWPAFTWPILSSSTVSLIRPQSEAASQPPVRRIAATPGRLPERIRPDATAAVIATSARYF